MQTIDLLVNLMLTINLVNLIFTVKVNRTVNRARATSTETSNKAELWNICPACYEHNKARIIGNQKRCAFCNTSMIPLLDFFEEEQAIEEAREELQYRKQLRNDSVERRKMLLESSPTPTILETEGQSKGVSRGGVVA